VQTSFSFHLYRSAEREGVRIGRGASIYLGTMFDVGRHGRVAIGAFTLVNGARIVCDAPSRSATTASSPGTWC
jgi:hypothetical protein